MREMKWVAAAIFGPTLAVVLWRGWLGYQAIKRVTVSDTAKEMGLSNWPSWRLWLPAVRLDKAATAVLTVLRARWPKARLSSAIRVPAVNAAVGGVADSQHMIAGALDFAGVPPADAAPIVKQELLRLGYTGAEIIVEGDHVHAEGLA